MDYKHTDQTTVMHRLIFACVFRVFLFLPFNKQAPNMAFQIELNGFVVLNPYRPSVLFVGHRQTLQKVASDQGLHCFLAECSINI